MALPIIVKWGGQEYSVTTLSEDDTVLDLKQFLKTLTGVLPERQKLLGLKVKGNAHFMVSTLTVRAFHICHYRLFFFFKKSFKKRDF
jgi:hypothetical protein